MVDTSNPVKNNIESVNEHYGLQDEDISHPTNYKTIIWYQQKDKELIKIAKKTKIILYRIFIRPIRNVLLSIKIVKL